MMTGKIAMCVEQAACESPQVIGLDGEDLESQPWLDVYTSGEETRAGVASGSGIDELWVVSCADVEPINLAASVKSDFPGLSVRLVTAEACGSLFSRAHTANIDEVMEFGILARRYAEAKRGASGRVSAGEREQVEELGESVVQASATVIEAPAPSAAEERRKPSPAMGILQFQPQPALARIPSDSRAFVLTVVSGSGGAGKSAVSTVGAVVSQLTGHKTLLLDCDLQFGDVAGMVGADHPLCVDEALMHPERLESDLVVGDSPAVLAAPQRLEASEEVVRQLPGLIEILSAKFDVIVVNTGASWAEQHAVLLERSSAALFLIDQRASSVQACRHALGLCARCGIAANPFQFALNRCSKGAPLTSIDVSCALQGAPVYEFKDGGRDVEDYLSSGAAVELVKMRNEFAKSIEHVMGKLLPVGKGQIIELDVDASERRPSRKLGRRSASKRGRRRQ